MFAHLRRLGGAPGGRKGKSGACCSGPVVKSRNGRDGKYFGAGDMCDGSTGNERSQAGEYAIDCAASGRSRASRGCIMRRIDKIGDRACMALALIGIAYILYYRLIQIV
jgi:hypothetical protein